MKNLIFIPFSFVKRLLVLLCLLLLTFSLSCSTDKEASKVNRVDTDKQIRSYRQWLHALQCV